MKTKVGINGFGRIGRLVTKALLQNENIEIVAINDLTDTKTLAHLLKYDSVHGRFSGQVSATENTINIGGHTVQILSQKDPSLLPWKELGVSIVIECTGRFTTQEALSTHLTAGASQVVLSAPAKGGVKTIVLGVNQENITSDDNILSNASCTTNCLAPMAKVLDDNFGIEKGYITTIHAYTADQRIQDAPHRDLRRARAASCSIIPTSTGAARAVGLVLPHLKGKLDGCAMRVPTPDGSLTDLTVVLKKEASAEEINTAMKSAAETHLKGILEYTEDPIVSIDIVGNPSSCIFDSGLTSTQGTLAKVVGWYDNEAGYAHRLADLVEFLRERN